MSGEIVSVFREATFIESRPMQIVLLFLLILLLLLYEIIKTKNKTNLYNRLKPHIVKSDQEHNTFDIVSKLYYFWIDKLDVLLIKSHVFNFSFNHYQKYLKTINDHYNHPVSYISEKITILLFLLILLIIIPLWYIILLFIIITLTMESFNHFKYQKHQSDLQKQFEKIITIMNNSFKAGSSILQAIELVTVKTKGTLTEEFKRIYQEIKLGLSVEEAFLKLAKRIELSQLQHLALTMAILSKSGGRVNELFSAMQKRIFHQKEIELELISVTSGLKIITYILAIMPFAITLGLYTLNSQYFQPLFSTSIGSLLLFIIVLLYLSYLIIIKKVFDLRV